MVITRANSNSSLSPPGTPFGASTAGCFYLPLGCRAPQVATEKQSVRSTSDTRALPSQRQAQMKKPPAASQGVTTNEVQSMLANMKSEMLAEIRMELGDLTTLIRESNQSVSSRLDRLAADLEALQAETKRKGDSPTKRIMAQCAQTICGKESAQRTSSKDLVTSSQMSLADEAVVTPLPMSASLCLHASGMHGVPKQVPPKGASAAAEAGATTGAQSKQAGESLLAPIVVRFQAAVGSPGAKLSAQGELTEAAKEPFISGLEALAVSLDKLPGNMGSYLVGNIKKLRASKADSSICGYREWLLSELPVHAATGYKGYVDDSAWMGNLWIGWQMEFFVEFFGCLVEEQKDTKAAVDSAYKKSLYNHHNYLQRMTFTAAVTQIPRREKVMQLLKGTGTPEETEQDMKEFVKFGRSLVRFCLNTNTELDQRMQAERKAPKR